MRTPGTVIAKSNSILSLAYRLTRNDVPKGNIPDHQQNQLHHGLKASQEGTSTKNGGVSISLSS
jgi:hypothetical protein